MNSHYIAYLALQQAQLLIDSGTFRLAVAAADPHHPVRLLRAARRALAVVLLGAAVSVLAPAAALAGAADCTTDTAKVSYSTVYDTGVQADVIRKVDITGLPIGCNGRTLVVVFTRDGASISNDFAAVVSDGTALVSCDGYAPKVVDVNGISMWFKDAIK